MSRIQFVDLDMSSDNEGTGDVIISKHEVRTRLGWFNSKELPWLKQELEKTDAVEDVTKTNEAVCISITTKHTGRSTGRRASIG